MKRPIILLCVLILVLITWGGLNLSIRQQQKWLATARREELERYVVAHADQAEAMVRLCVLLRNAGERSEAEKWARRAVELAPAEEGYWIELSRTVPEDSALTQSLERLLNLKPQSGTVMAELARRYLQVGDVGKARILADRAIQASPESPEGWQVRGDMLAALRQLPAAEKDYRKALALGGGTETRLALARLLIPLQRYPEIIQLCAPIIREGQSPDVSQEARARALIYTAGGRLYDPLTPFELAAIQTQLREADTLTAQLRPAERFLPPYFLGESYLRMNKPLEAIPMLERSAAASPLFAGSLYSLARAYRLSGNMARANETIARHARLSRILGELDMYNNRLEQRPDDVETLLHLAGVLTEAGSRAEAAEIYQRLISEGKSKSLAQRKLKELPSH